MHYSDRIIQKATMFGDTRNKRGTSSVTPTAQVNKGCPWSVGYKPIHFAIVAAVQRQLSKKSRNNTI